MIPTDDADRVLELLHADGALSLVAVSDELEAEAKDARVALQAAAAAGDAVRSLTLQARHGLLCAHQHGPYGVSH